MRRSFTSIVAVFASIATGAAAQQSPPSAAAASKPAASGPRMLLGGVEVPGLPKAAPLRPPPTPSTTSPQKGSLWSCPGTVHDFGEVWQGEDVTYRFELENIGTEDLQVLDATPECHCTVAGQFDRIIKPGKSGFVPFTLHTAGLGRFLVKHASIRTNDRLAGLLTVELHGTVKTLFEMKPNDLGSFGEVVDPAKEVVREAEITSNIDEPWEFLPPLVQDSPPFRLEIKEVEKGKRFHATLKVIPPVPAGYVNRQLFTKTSNPHLPSWMLFISLFRPERIAARPQALLMPNVVQRSDPMTVELQNHGTTPFKVLSAEVKDTPELTTEIKPDGTGYKVLIHAPMGYKLPDARKLQIKTDDKQLPLLEVTLYKIVERPNLPPLQVIRPQETPRPVPVPATGPTPRSSARRIGPLKPYVPPQENPPPPK